MPPCQPPWSSSPETDRRPGERSSSILGDLRHVATAPADMRCWAMMNTNRDRLEVGPGRVPRLDSAPPWAPNSRASEGGTDVAAHQAQRGLPPRSRLVRRKALLERLSACPPGGVALVCGPAGSGKTVLLRSWAEAVGPDERVAWVAVERGEQDPQHFWLSVIDALADADGKDVIERAAPT